MNKVTESKLYHAVEGKRGLSKKREYKIYLEGEKTPLFEVKEKLNPIKGFFRFFGSLTGGNAMSAFKLYVIDANGKTHYTIRKGMGTIEMASFRLKNESGDTIGKCSNKIKFKDDSFIEIFDGEKNKLFKSGLGGGGRTWYPIYIYEADKAGSEDYGNTISGEVFCEISKTSGTKLFNTSGDQFDITFAAPPKDMDTFARIVNFLVCVDFAYDTK